jgi:predicted DNA-binding transcriptional regulator YafY
MPATLRPKAPRPGRPNGRFTQHRRLDKLRDTLTAHPGGLALDDLATLLHVTTRSVRRYLHELSLVTEIESIETRPGGAHLWRIKPSERGRTVAFRRTQAYGLLAARRIFDVMKGSALYDELDVALRQVTQVAQRPTRAPGMSEAPVDPRLEERFVYLPPGPRNYTHKSEEIDGVFQAVAELRTLRFRYKPSGAARHEEQMTVNPYAMILHKGAIYFVGRDLGDGKVKTFVFDYVSDARASETERFALPPEFDINEYLEGDFGIARAEQRTRVLIEFEARAADEVRSRRVHPTQKIATAPDGRVRLSMVVSDIESVKSWVLGFGSAARVIEPAELSLELVRELRRTLGRYGA